jgi:Ras-related protein Rab-18
MPHSLRRSHDIPINNRLTGLQLKKLSVHGKAYRLNLLDTAGQERFRTLSNSYYRGAHGVILVYDISNRESFLAMERWFEEAESNAMPGAVMYLVGSKMDKASARTVKVEEGLELAAKHGCQFCEVSSKTRENVRKPFVEIVDAIVKDPKLLSAGSRRSGTVSVTGAGGEGGGCSC